MLLPATYIFWFNDTSLAINRRLLIDTSPTIFVSPATYKFLLKDTSLETNNLPFNDKSSATINSKLVVDVVITELLVYCCTDNLPITFKSFAIYTFPPNDASFATDRRLLIDTSPTKTDLPPT